MRLDALKVAAAIFEHASGFKVPITTKEITNLAICLSDNNGAFRIGHTREVWLVLGSLLHVRESDTLPCIVEADLTIRLPPDELYVTQQVARQFTDEARKGLKKPADWFFPEGYNTTWAHALARDIPGRVSIGGVSEPPVAYALEPSSLERYDLYDLRPVECFPLGCVVFRMGTDNVLVAYQRLEANTWRKIRVPSPVCPVDIPKIRHDLQLTAITPLEGDPPRLTRPHSPGRRR